MTANKRNKKPITEIIIAILTLIGNPIYSTKNLKLPFRAKFIIMLSSITLFLGIINIYAYWNDTNRRILILLDIISGGNALVAINALIYNPNIAITLTDVMKYSRWFENYKYIKENNIFNISNEANTISWNIAW